MANLFFKNMESGLRGDKGLVLVPLGIYPVDDGSCWRDLTNGEMLQDPF